MAGIKVLGYGHARGEREVTNDDLSKIVDTTDEWIKSKSGIESRFFAENKDDDDLAMEAAVMALDTAGMKAEEIDLIVVCTFTGVYATPQVACRIAGKLGIGDGVLAIDVNGACSGFVYGFQTAYALLESGRCKKALVIGSEKLTTVMDMNDRNTCVLFGDGAGALICEYDPDGLFVSNAGCHPDEHILGCKRGEGGIFMHGQEVYRFAVSKIPESMNKAISDAGLTKDDIDWFVCHQANMRIINSVARKVGAPKEKVFTNIQYTGNTSAASIAICLGEMMDKGLLKSGQTAVCTSFGAGLTWGSVLFRV